MTTVDPEKKTARVAESPALLTGSPFLSEALHNEQRVVDPDGEADHRDHVHDEEGQLECLSDDHGHPDGNQDCHNRQKQRDTGGDGSPEDDYKDQERNRQTEDLTPLQSLIGECPELVVDGAVSHCGDRELRCVGAFENAEHRDYEIPGVSLSLKSCDDECGAAIFRNRSGNPIEIGDYRTDIWGTAKVLNEITNGCGKHGIRCYVTARLDDHILLRGFIRWEMGCNQVVACGSLGGN